MKIMSIGKRDVAVALCGGGSKGAFQIGAWQALEELEFFPKIKAVAGTSVGCLNALLFASSDCESAKEIWYGIDHGTLLRPNIKNEGLFDRDGLRNIIRNVLCKKKPSDFKMEIYAILHNYDKNRIESFHLNEMSRNKIEKCLLATSAIPVVYSPVFIDEKKYIDGGFTSLGNTPVKTLYDLGYRVIYIISMDEKLNISKIKVPDSDRTLEQYCANCVIKIIRPDKNVGETLDFSQSHIRKCMELGYRRTYEAFGKTAPITDGDWLPFDERISIKAQRILKCDRDFKDFLACKIGGNYNMNSNVIGGHVWYKDILNADGWRIQQHPTPMLKSHYRIIDPNNVRCAWYMNPKELLDDLKRFEKTRQCEDFTGT